MMKVYGSQDNQFQRPRLDVALQFQMISALIGKYQVL